MGVQQATMRTVRFHEFGEPGHVLQLERAPVPDPGADRILVRVQACGVNPADWALCRGLFPGRLPRGVGLEVSGAVAAIGVGVTDVAVGDLVLGTTDYAGTPSAGAADLAIMDHWTGVPDGLDLVEAAALPMAVQTAYIHLESLGVKAGQTLVVNGAGTTVGFAAVQMALLRGARVIATAGDTNADRLRALGAAVTPYGEGAADRIGALAGGPVDLVLDTAPPSGSLPGLVQAAGGDPRRVLTLSDMGGAAEVGARDTFHEEGLALRYDMHGQFAQLAAEGKFTIPVAQTFDLEDWRTALDVSLSGRARGKLVLLPGGVDAGR